MASTVVSIALPKSTYEAIHVFAREHQMTPSAVGRKALHELLGYPKDATDAPTRGFAAARTIVTSVTDPQAVRLAKQAEAKGVPIEVEAMRLLRDAKMRMDAAIKERELATAQAAELRLELAKLQAPAVETDGQNA